MIDIDLHPEAFRDYQEAYDWYAERELQAAEDFDAELQAALAKLIQDPSFGVSIDRDHFFYRLKRFPFYVVFRVRGDVLWVIAVSHNRRDPTYWRGR
jgi:plasmid stabilization system protein ParE